MNYKPINKFIKNTILACWPIAVLVALFLIADPYHLLKEYDIDNATGEFLEPHNRCHQAVETYLNYRDSIHYNAFLLGSSRSIYYQIDDWKKYLPEDAEPFHFDSARETIEGIRDKLKFINEHGDSIKYAILELYGDEIIQEDWDRPAVRQDYRLETGDNIIIFFYKYFRDVYNSSFLQAYFHYLLTGEQKKIGETDIFEDKPLRYNKHRNEYDFHNLDNRLDTDSLLYFKTSRMTYFKYTPDSIADPIPANKKKIVTEIAEIFKKNNTDYVIILGPSYKRLFFGEQDIEYFTKIFGKDHIYDFQRYGIDKRTNFYDFIHYRHFICSEIMKRIYTERQKE